MAKTVVGLFDNFNEARDAVSELETSGIPHDQVSIVANDSGGASGASAINSTNADNGLTAGETADAAATGAVTGATAGTAIGGTVGLLAGLGALTIPGFGPVIAAGWLVSAIAGAGIGAATGAAAGGLIGALTEAGVPEHEAGYYEEGVRRGGTLVTVTCDDGKASDFVSIMHRHNVVDIERRGAEYQNAGYVGRAGYDNSGLGSGTGAGSIAGPISGYSGVATGSNTGYNATESDLGLGADSSKAANRSGSDSNQRVGADADHSGAAAAANRGHAGINTDQGINATGYSGVGASEISEVSREQAGVAHENMPSRDDMKSSIPNTTATSDAGAEVDEENLGDTDRDLNRNRPGGTNVY